MSGGAAGKNFGWERCDWSWMAAVVVLEVDDTSEHPHVLQVLDWEEGSSEGDVVWLTSFWAVQEVDTTSDR